MQDAVSEIDFKYADGKLSMSGTFEYDAGVGIEMITLLGAEGGAEAAEYDTESKKMTMSVNVPLTGAKEIMLG